VSNAQGLETSFPHLTSHYSPVDEAVACVVSRSSSSIGSEASQVLLTMHLVVATIILLVRVLDYEVNEMTSDNEVL